MTPTTRVRREVFLAPYVDQIVTSRAQRSARTKSQVVTDAILAFNALLAGTLPAESIAANARQSYGVEANGG